MRTHRVFELDVLDGLAGIPGHPLCLEQQLADLPGIDERTGRVLEDGGGDDGPDEAGCMGIASEAQDTLAARRRGQRRRQQRRRRRQRRRLERPRARRVHIQFSQ